MLLTGTYERSIDEKMRLAVPKRIRDAIGTPDHCVIYIAPGTDQSLDLYPEAAFERLATQLESAAPNGGDVRKFSRIFYAQTERCEVDKQGRIRIPPELAQHGSIDKEVVLLGVRDHIELWNKQLWEDYLKRGQDSYDEIAENAFGSPPSKTNTHTETQAIERVKPR